MEGEYLEIIMVEITVIVVSKAFDVRNLFVLRTTHGCKFPIQTTKGMQDKFSSLRTFILDEADQLLDMGFQPDLKKIIALLPPNTGSGKYFVPRQTLMFTATVDLWFHFPPHISSIYFSSPPWHILRTLQNDYSP